MRSGSPHDLGRRAGESPQPIDRVRHRRRGRRVLCYGQRGLVGPPHMRRRDFITIFGSAVAWPLAARAQQPDMPVVGFLSGGSPVGFAYLVHAFRQGLSETGYIDGQNVVLELRWAEGQYERLPALVADLVRRKVAVLAATTTPAALAAKAATTTIPIVFATDTDPVQVGLTASLSRPGANITGVSNLNVEVGPKRLELAHELFPAATTIALLVNPTNPLAEIVSRDLQSVARSLGVELHVLHARTESDFEPVFTTAAQMRAAALVIGSADPLFGSRAEQLGALALRHGVPAIYQFREFATGGGLVSYGGRFTDSYRQVGVYTGRILKGEKPADLPVVQSTKVEMILNLKTAKALGITVPLPLLGRADEVIE
jgi:putative tryptophan/tyrosine transport system substrate-binding protein